MSVLALSPELVEGVESWCGRIWLPCGSTHHEVIMDLFQDIRGPITAAVQFNHEAWEKASTGEILNPRAFWVEILAAIVVAQQTRVKLDGCYDRATDGKKLNPGWVNQRAQLRHKLMETIEGLQLLANTVRKTIEPGIAEIAGFPAFRVKPDPKPDPVIPNADVMRSFLST